MNRDELEGKAEALNGNIMQAIGDLTNNPHLHDEDVVDEVTGKAQGAVGHIRRRSETSSRTRVTPRRNRR